MPGRKRDDLIANNERKALGGHDQTAFGPRKRREACSISVTSRR